MSRESSVQHVLFLVLQFAMGRFQFSGVELEIQVYKHT